MRKTVTDRVNSTSRFTLVDACAASEIDNGELLRVSVHDGSARS
jgi:hypothetical protein